MASNPPSTVRESGRRKVSNLPAWMKDNPNPNPDEVGEPTPASSAPVPAPAATTKKGEVLPPPPSGALPGLSQVSPSPNTNNMPSNMSSLPPPPPGTLIPLILHTDLHPSLLQSILTALDIHRPILPLPLNLLTHLQNIHNLPPNTASNPTPTSLPLTNMLQVFAVPVEFQNLHIVLPHLRPLCTGEKRGRERKREEKTNKVSR